MNLLNSDRANLWLPGTEGEREEEGIVEWNEETFGAMGMSTVLIVPGAHIC